MSPDTPRPPRGEARRGLILEAVLRVIGEEGVGAVTHRRVATEAGLPLAATTYWFASKDELLAEAYRVAADRDSARMRALGAAFAAGEHDDLAATLTDLLTTELAEGRTSLIAAYALWLEAARRPVLQAIEQEWTAVCVHVVGDILRAAGSAHPETDAGLLVATLDGLLLHQLAPGHDDPATRLRPQLERLVAALLREP